MHINFCFLFILHKQTGSCRIRPAANKATSGDNPDGIYARIKTNTTDVNP